MKKFLFLFRRLVSLRACFLLGIFLFTIFVESLLFIQVWHTQNPHETLHRELYQPWISQLAEDIAYEQTNGHLGAWKETISHLKVISTLPMVKEVILSPRVLKKKQALDPVPSIFLTHQDNMLVVANISQASQNKQQNSEHISNEEITLNYHLTALFPPVYHNAHNDTPKVIHFINSVTASKQASVITLEDSHGVKLKKYLQKNSHRLFDLDLVIHTQDNQVAQIELIDQNIVLSFGLLLLIAVPGFFFFAIFQRDLINLSTDIKTMEQTLTPAQSPLRGANLDGWKKNATKVLWRKKRNTFREFIFIGSHLRRIHKKVNRYLTYHTHHISEYQNIIENNKWPILTISNQYEILMMNAAARKMLVPPMRPKNQRHNLKPSIYPEDREIFVQKIMGSHLGKQEEASQNPIALEVRFLSSTNKVIAGRVTAFPLLYPLRSSHTQENEALQEEDYVPYGCTLIIECDPHTNQELASLREAKKSAEATNEINRLFMRSLRHEILTPINGIVNISKLMREESGKENPDLAKGLSIIEESGDRILSIFNQIMDLSAAEQGPNDTQIESFMLQDVIDKIHSICANFAKNNSTRLVASSTKNDEASKIFCIGNKHMLAQTLVYSLIHLCRTPRTMSIALDVKSEAKNIIFTLSTPLAAQQEKTTTPHSKATFFPKYKDLHIASANASLLRRNIEQMQGMLVSEKTEEHFTLYITLPRIYLVTAKNKEDPSPMPMPLSLSCALPQSHGEHHNTKLEPSQSQVQAQHKEIIMHDKKDPALAPQPRPSSQDIRRQEMSEDHEKASFYILVIEDEQIGRETARLVLKNYERSDILFAATGKEARQYYSEYLTKIIGVFMDMHLPDTNGFDLFTELKAIDASKPIIALTGEDDDEFIHSVFAKGFFDYLGKPYTPGEMIQKCETFFLQHQESLV